MVPAAAHEANWLGLVQSDGAPASALATPSTSTDSPAKPKVRFSRRSSAASNDEDRISARSVVSFDFGGRDGFESIRIGLVIREPANGIATVRIQGSSRTVEVPVEKLKRLPDLPALGVSRECLRSFREAHAELLKGMKASDAWSKLLQPIAKVHGRPIAAAIHSTEGSSRHSSASLSESSTSIAPEAVEAPRGFAAPATVFACFAEDTLFMDVLEGLEAFAAERVGRGEAEPYFWVRSFCADPEHEPPERMPPLWVEKVFPDALEKIGHTCIILTPWEEPLPLRSSWCLYEMLCTVLRKKEVTVQLPPTYVADFERALHADPARVMSAVHRLKVDVEGGAKHCPHRGTILTALQSIATGTRTSELNGKITRSLRKWLSAEGESALERMTPEARKTTSELQHQLGVLQMELGNLEQAEKLLREELEWKRTALGDSDARTLEAAHQVSVLLRRAGGPERMEQSVELGRKNLAARREVLGEQDENTVQSREELALTLQALGKLDEAETLFKEALIARKAMAKDGSDGAGALPAAMTTTLNNLASLMRVKAEKTLKEAEPLLREALQGKIKNLGKRHPETLISVNQLGQLLRNRLAPVEEVEALLSEALEGRLEALGPRHPQTLNARGNLADLLRERGRLDQANEAMSNAVEISTEVLGAEHRVTTALQAKRDKLDDALAMRAKEQAGSDNETTTDDDEVDDMPKKLSHDGKTASEIEAAAMQEGSSKGRMQKQLQKTLMGGSGTLSIRNILEGRASRRSRSSRNSRSSRSPRPRKLSALPVNEVEREALLRLLCHTKEELLMIFSRADRDHSGDVSKDEFDLALQMVGGIDERAHTGLHKAFKFAPGHDRAIHDLLHRANVLRMRHRSDVERMRHEQAEAEKRAARGLNRISLYAKQKLVNQIWATESLPHFDVRPPKTLVSTGPSGSLQVGSPPSPGAPSPAGATEWSVRVGKKAGEKKDKWANWYEKNEEEEKRVEQMTSLGYSRRTTRHTFSDAALINALGLQQLAEDEANEERSTLSGQVANVTATAINKIKGAKGADIVKGAATAATAATAAATATAADAARRGSVDLANQLRRFSSRQSGGGDSPQRAPSPEPAESLAEGSLSARSARTRRQRLAGLLERSKVSDDVERSRVELFLLGKARWLRQRATKRLADLNEDCSELRKLSRAYELVNSTLPKERQSPGEQEALLQFLELMMNLYAALRDSTIRLKYFAVPQPNAKKKDRPRWDRNKPTLKRHRRVMLGARLGIILLFFSMAVRLWKLFYINHEYEPATGLSAMAFRVECECVWQYEEEGGKLCEWVEGRARNGYRADVFDLQYYNVTRDDCEESSLLREFGTISVVVPAVSFLSVVLTPWFVMRGNINKLARRKLLRTLPVVLILLQSFLRSLLVILVTGDAVGQAMLETGATRRIIISQIFDAGFLLFGSYLFIFMDCCNEKAPVLRMMLGLTLLLCLLDAIWKRSRYIFPSEQAPVVRVDEDLYFFGIAASPKQGFISTFDYSVLSLMLSGIVTTIRFPHKLAFIHLRADLYGVAADREVTKRQRRSTERERKLRGLASGNRGWKRAKRELVRSAHRMGSAAEHMAQSPSRLVSSMSLVSRRPFHTSSLDSCAARAAADDTSLRDSCGHPVPHGASLRRFGLSRPSLHRGAASREDAHTPAARPAAAPSAAEPGRDVSVLEIEVAPSAAPAPAPGPSESKV